MHKQFDQQGKGVSKQSILYGIGGAQWRKVGMHKQFDQLGATVNLRTVWHLRSLFWSSHPLLVNDDNIKGDNIDDDNDDENYDDNNDDNDDDENYDDNDDDSETKIKSWRG